MWQRGKHPSFSVGTVIPHDINSGCTPYDGERGVLSCELQSLSPAMQNPGALVTVKAAIKPPGFKFFLLNEAQIIANGCWLNQQ